MQLARYFFTALLLPLAALAMCTDAHAQLLLPSPAGFTRGQGECSEIVAAIASPSRRVRNGDVFEVWAKKLPDGATPTYQWSVSNGKIVSGQSTDRIRIKAGRQKTPGYINVSSFVTISLTLSLASRACSVTTAHRVMVGEHREANQIATVVDADFDEPWLAHPCRPGYMPREGLSTSKDSIVGVRVNARDPENDFLTYNFHVSAGKITNAGADAKWDLTGVEPGTYTLSVGVDDGGGIFGKTVTKSFTVKDGGCWVDIECPSLSLSDPGTVGSNEIVELSANVSGGSVSIVTYHWRIEGGDIVEGQGSPTIKVKMSAGAIESRVFVKVNYLELHDNGNCITEESRILRYK